MTATEDDTLVNWVQKFGFYTILGFIGLLIGSVVAYKMIANKRASQEIDYIKAKQISLLIDKGIGSLENRDKALRQLMALVAKNPELHSEYDAKIAQELLNQGKAKEAEVFADLAILRSTNDHLPFYSDFSEITLMTSKGDYKEALDKTLMLKSKMIQNLSECKVKKETKKFGDVLFAYNLLREVFLMQQVKDKAGEKRAWQEFSAYAGVGSNVTSKEPLSREAFQKVASQFVEGKETLFSYMEQRLKAL